MAMLADSRELDINLDLSRPRVGHIDRWARVAVVIALVATLAVLIAGPRVIWVRDAHTIGLPRFWFHNALMLGFVTTIVLACVPAGQSSRFVRLAVLLPVVQTAFLAVAWIAWQLLRPRMPLAADATQMFVTLPLRVVVPAMAIAIALAARLVARRRRREWLHAVVMISLVNLLFLGLWLPIASDAWNGWGFEVWDRIEKALASPARMVAYVVVPPLVGATVFTATALRWPQIWRRNSGLVGAVVFVALVIATAYRKDVMETGAFVYVNFLHVLASAALVTVGAIAVLGGGTWLANLRGRRRLARAGAVTGTIVHSDACDTLTVASLEQTSWLRGPRPATAAFSVTTPKGEIPVPPGAHVVAAPPLATTLLRAGETVPTLRCGDRVVLAGFVDGTGDGPFRQTSAPIAGADGITIGRAEDERYGLAHVGLDLWRPSLAYLVILAVVAVPGLAALLSGHF